MTDFEVKIAATGTISESAKAYARDKIAKLGHLTRRPVLFAEVKLTAESNPKIERSYVAEANLDVNGRLVRAHVAGHSPDEAVDLLEERLKRQLHDLSERRVTAREQAASREQAANEAAARDGARTYRPEWFDRPVAERELVAHKTWATDPMTVDEAAFDMDMLDFDFYLFTEATTGVDSVLARSDDGDEAYELRMLDPVGGLVEGAANPVHVHGQAPPEMTADEAVERLNLSGEPFVFFRNGHGRGNVVYRRYDGHYGLITPQT